MSLQVLLAADFARAHDEYIDGDAAFVHCGERKRRLP